MLFLPSGPDHGWTPGRRFSRSLLWQVLPSIWRSPVASVSPHPPVWPAFPFHRQTLPAAARTPASAGCPSTFSSRTVISCSTGALGGPEGAPVPHSQDKGTHGPRPALSSPCCSAWARVFPGFLQKREGISLPSHPKMRCQTEPKRLRKAECSCRRGKRGSGETNRGGEGPAGTTEGLPHPAGARDPPWSLVSCSQALSYCRVTSEIHRRETVTVEKESKISAEALGHGWRHGLPSCWGPPCSELRGLPHGRRGQQRTQLHSWTCK